MKFALIICTYKRPEPLQRLLLSVLEQSLYPDAVLIIDGSPDRETEKTINASTFKNITYIRVSKEDRGLTKQRNFGIRKVNPDMEVVCFLDDDIVLKPHYFEVLLQTYDHFPQALGVGGYIVNEVDWRKEPETYKARPTEFCYDGYCRKDGSRFVLRKKLGLDADRPPACLPDFGHGRSVSFLPPSGKTYEVEQFMGGVASYKKEVLDRYSFSEYFEGYGLYEDADFTLRLSKEGSLYVNTAAQLYHYHDASGRPDAYGYGKMVIRNGWYVWRVKYPRPALKACIKWNATAWLLTLIRFSNVFTASDKKEAFMEVVGRTVGWWSLLINKPNLR